MLTSKIFFAIILKHLRDCTIYSSIAQSVEHAAVNRRVVGSSPTWGAKTDKSELYANRRRVRIYFLFELQKCEKRNMIAITLC